MQLRKEPFTFILYNVYYLYLYHHMKLNEKKCKTCGNKFEGRSDKKFCSTHCRNVFNNQRKNDYFRGVDFITKRLIQNRQILITLSKQRKIQFTKFDLLHLGFDFRYFTDTLPLNNGSIIYYVHDYLYQVYSDLQIMIIPLEHPTRRTFKTEIMFY